MKVTIDRIDGTVAILIPRVDESERMNVPVSLLPPGCQEGDILTIQIEWDRAETEAAKERVSGLIEKLKKRK
jgi:hypothetical protein